MPQVSASRTFSSERRQAAYAALMHWRRSHCSEVDGVNDEVCDSGFQKPGWDIDSQLGEFSVQKKHMLKFECFNFAQRNRKA